MKKSYLEFREVLFRRPFPKRLLLMIIAVVVMGICVAILKMTHFGVDPFSAFCYGLSDATGISFGTTEVIVHAIMLLFVVLTGLSKLGFGTLGNMILVGYTADFVTWIMGKLGIYSIDSFATRVIVLIIMLSIFIVAAAVYMNAGLGASAYDSLPVIIHEGVCKLSGKDIRFRYVRMLFDAFFTTVSFLIHGQAGIMTVGIVFFLGPAVEAVGKVISRVFKLDESN